MRNWGQYKNGNYNVMLSLTDGTKIRFNNEESFIPDNIENFDYKITEVCDAGCPFCFENSTINGRHGDIMHESFIDTLHPYTEIAIGGGDPTSHPDLIPFLQKCKDLKLVPSITVNQIHFEKKQELIKYLVDNRLIYGLGISLTSPTNDFIEKVKCYDNAVIHIINGVVTDDEINALSNHDLKILILGYKTRGRGKTLFNNVGNIIKQRMDMMEKNISHMLMPGIFKAVSFDNRALQQLDIKNKIPKDIWEKHYMGDDGISGSYTSASMFVDGVNRTFSLNSCCDERFPLMSDVKEMFNFLVKRYSK